MLFRSGPALGNGGLYCTADDYARFCQMLLGNGAREGRRVLSPPAVKVLSSVHTGDLPTGVQRLLRATEEATRKFEDGAGGGWQAGG